MTSFRKPTAQEIAAARGKKVPDVIAAGLKVLFCGINPSLYSAAVGHHFARPGNRFWPVLHAAGFTPRLFSPFEDGALPGLGYGITNLVDRATATAAELDDEELRRGARALGRKVRRYRPQVVAFLGVGSYRTAFGRPKAGLGLQTDRLADVGLWVLPNPSGLNAHYRLADLARLYGELRQSLSI
jgi:TDG/mug DNA glycosylase family protein